MSEHVQQSKPEETRSFAEIAQYLNDEFEHGTPAYQVLDDIRTFPRPIVVDFNNVLVSRTPPYKSNPQALEALQELRQAGTVFVVTIGHDWHEVHDGLAANALLFSEMIIMTAPSYVFLTSHEPWNQQGKLLRENYAAMIHFSPDDFNCIPGQKAIAPLFGKPFRVPILDDTHIAVEDNPNMYGILIKPYTGDELDTPRADKGSRQQLPALKPAKQPVPLSDAAKMVTTYYGF